MRKLLFALVAIYGSSIWFSSNPGAISRAFNHSFQDKEPQVLIEERVSYRDKEDPRLEEVIGEAAQRYQIPQGLLYAIAKVESGIRESNDSVRSEGHLEAKHGEMNSKSYGVMQIMGFNAASLCSLSSWSELVGPKNLQNNVDCGARILKKCMDRARRPLGFKADRKGSEVFTNALNCYNGDKTGVYAQKVLLAYSELQLAKMS